MKDQPLSSLHQSVIHRWFNRRRLATTISKDDNNQTVDSWKTYR